MPLPKGYEVFPAGYDKLEAHVAGVCACVVFTGNPDADDLSIAAFERLFHEEAEKNPTVPPSVMAANILTYIERDMSIERVDFVGSPLRVTWFVLGYHAWVLIAVRCGRVHLGDDAVSEIRGKVLAAMAELGVTCSPEECDAEIERFVPRQSALTKNESPTTRDISHEVVVAGRRHRLGDRNRPLLDVRCGVIPREVTGGEAKALSGRRPIPGHRGSVPPGPDRRRRHRGTAKPDSRR